MTMIDVDDATVEAIALTRLAAIYHAELDELRADVRARLRDELRTYVLPDTAPDVEVFRDVVRAVGRLELVQPDDVLADNRTQAVVRARHLSWWAIRHRLGWSYQRIANAHTCAADDRRRHRVDHSTVLDAVSRIAAGRHSQRLTGRVLERVDHALGLDDDGAAA